MKISVFQQILNYRNNRDNYTLEERKKIKAALRAKLEMQSNFFDSYIKKVVDNINDV